MKKYLFILAGLLCLLGQGEAEARAVKLGRGTSIGGIRPGPEPCTGSNCSGPGPTFCPANCASCNGSSCSKCKSGYYLKNGGCTPCPANATCSGTETITCNTGFHRSATGTTCTECSDITVANGTCTACQAVGNTCTNVSCYYGYVKSGTTCSAISFSGMSCVSGYRKVVSSDRACCVPMCQGVSCVSGYTPTATSTGCCCQATITPIANCATQNGNTCTKCSSGYYLSSNTCKACPSNATCTGTSTFTCSSGYYQSGNSCVSCPANSTCTSSTSFTCNSGYYKNGSSCSRCPSGCSACTSSTKCTACSSGTLVNGSCVDDCDYWSIAYNSCSQGYRKPKSGGSCEKCPANTQCGTCPSGCTGSTAGTCQKIGKGLVSCFMCATHEIVYDCTCPSGYKRSLDGTTCLSDTGAPQMCSYY